MHDKIIEKYLTESDKSWKITKKKVTDQTSDIFINGIKVAELSRRLTWTRGGSSRVASKQVMMNSLYWVTQGLKELFNSNSITTGTQSAKEPKDFYHINPTTSAISNEFILKELDAYTKKTN